PVLQRRAVRFASRVRAGRPSRRPAPDGAAPCFLFERFFHQLKELGRVGQLHQEVGGAEPHGPLRPAEVRMLGNQNERIAPVLPEQLQQAQTCLFRHRCDHEPRLLRRVMLAEPRAPAAAGLSADAERWADAGLWAAAGFPAAAGLCFSYILPAEIKPLFASFARPSGRACSSEPYRAGALQAPRARQRISQEYGEPRWTFSPRPGRRARQPTAAPSPRAAAPAHPSSAAAARRHGGPRRAVIARLRV